MTSAFERLLADLSEAEVDYILVGGLAVAFCGHVRATEDVDILVPVDDDTARGRPHDSSPQHRRIDHP